MAYYRLVRTGPERDWRFAIEKLTLFRGWREIDFFYNEERAMAKMNEIEHGPTVLRVVEGE